MTSPVRASRYRYLDTVGDLDGIGIALAGGGVRAACLGLGALQAADECSVLRRTAYVSAVSGGSYIASAFLASRAQYQNDGESPPWGRGSPEEVHLRRNLRYLGEDFFDLFLGLVRYLVTMLVNLVPFVSAIVLAGCVFGAACRVAGLLVAEDDVLYARFVEHRLAVAAGISVLAVILEACFARAEWAIRHVGLRGPNKMISGRGVASR
ncbi:hypothetical protein [Planobispora takensis]|uniref:PNPLA domain-containing protein n=1 Tax=Planobispora takensis TaxID=1367882 RepID=A0A8J3T6V8_9ACTN|nr:hypothetical protein [Planobispora takensis]GII02059.1 hypothetical protein Pta02_40670 [Planobispora takensis]